MCTRPLTKSFPASVHERLLGLNSPRTLQLPCGKCAECLKKRQNDLATRVYLAAKSAGCATFVTLTYRSSSIPVAQSMWTINRDTGEYELASDVELVPNDKADVLRGLFVSYSKQYHGAPIIENEIKLFSELSPCDYVVRYTPTLYYEDVKSVMKVFRKKYKDIPSFKYTAVGEYGANPDKTQRPHYHLVFFGLNKEWCDKFADIWSRRFGFVSVKGVQFVNKDGSDGLARVSRYVGKYCSKGQFDCYTNKSGCTLHNRMRSSKGLGCDISEFDKRYFLAKDVCEYDELNPVFQDNDLKNKVIDTILRRSFIKINGYNFPLPLSFRRKLYGYQRTDTKGFKRPTMYAGKHLEIFEKAIYSPIYYMVADELRSRALAESDSKFRQFLAKFPTEDISDAVIAFNSYEELTLENREKATSQSILKFYQTHSKI